MNPIDVSGEIKKLIQKRVSCRSFDKNRTISTQDAMSICEAAALAPTGGNLQSFNLHIVHDALVLREIFKISGVPRKDGKIQRQGFILSAPLNVAIICNPKEGVNKWGHFLDWETEKERYLRVSIRDAAIASAFMVLRAESLGISSCYMSSYNQSDIRDIFKLDEDLYFLTLLSFGYPNIKAKNKNKKTLDQIIKNFQY